MPPLTPVVLYPFRDIISSVIRDDSTLITLLKTVAGEHYFARNQTKAMRNRHLLPDLIKQAKKDPLLKKEIIAAAAQLKEDDMY